MCVFQTLSEVRERTDIWMQKYNGERPYRAKRFNPKGVFVSLSPRNP